MTLEPHVFPYKNRLPTAPLSLGGPWQFGSQPGPDILQFKTVAPTGVILQPGHHQGWGWNFHNIFLSSIEDSWVVVSNMFYFHPYLGRWSSLTSIFFVLQKTECVGVFARVRSGRLGVKMGWNHQLDKIWRSSWIWSWYLQEQNHTSCHEASSRCLEIFPLKLGFVPTWMTTFNWFSLNPDASKWPFQKKTREISRFKITGFFLGTPLRWNRVGLCGSHLMLKRHRSPEGGSHRGEGGEKHRFHRWQRTNLALQILCYIDIN